MCIHRLCDGRWNQDHHLTKIINAMIIWRALSELDRWRTRRSDESTEPILFLIASPMAAAGFGTLAGHFTDRSVVTYDPRGSERSELTEPTIPPTPQEHAADVHRIIHELGGRPVDLFATSGCGERATCMHASPTPMCLADAHLRGRPRHSAGRGDPPGVYPGATHGPKARP
jgi:hypothetical protein